MKKILWNLLLAVAVLSFAAAQDSTDKRGSMSKDKMSGQDKMSKQDKMNKTAKRDKTANQDNMSDHEKMGKAMLMSADDMKWETPTMKDAPPGVQMVSLWGDMNKGAYGSMIKFTQAMDHPLHTHSHDVKSVVVSGSFWIAPENGDKKTFGPGSYFMIPGGWKHTSGADAGTVVFQEGPGKFDMKPMNMKSELMHK